MFHQQLAHLEDRYRLVTAGDLWAAAAGRHRGERFPVAVTFDDDLRSHAELAAPALARHNATATFFLTGASLRGPATFWWERLQRAIDEGVVTGAIQLSPGLHHDLERATAAETATIIERLEPAAREELSAALQERLGGEPPESGLRVQHVRDLAEAGFEIGFHTRRHHALPELSDGDLQQALEEGRNDLEHAAGHEMGVIAYPHGATDSRTAQAARMAGYRAGFTTDKAVASARGSSLLIGRLYPSRTSVGHFALQIVLALLREAWSRERVKARLVLLRSR